MDPLSSLLPSQGKGRAPVGGDVDVVLREAVHHVARALRHEARRGQARVLVLVLVLAPALLLALVLPVLVLARGTGDVVLVLVVTW